MTFTTSFSGTGHQWCKERLAPAGSHSPEAQGCRRWRRQCRRPSCRGPGASPRSWRGTPAPASSKTPPSPDHRAHARRCRGRGRDPSPSGCWGWPGPDQSSRPLAGTGAGSARGRRQSRAPRRAGWSGHARMTPGSGCRRARRARTGTWSGARTWSCSRTGCSCRYCRQSGCARIWITINGDARTSNLKVLTWTLL